MQIKKASSIRSSNFSFQLRSKQSAREKGESLTIEILVRRVQYSL